MADPGLPRKPDDSEPTPAQRLILILIGFGLAAVFVVGLVFGLGWLFS